MLQSANGTTTEQGTKDIAGISSLTLSPKRFRSVPSLPFIICSSSTNYFANFETTFSIATPTTVVALSEKYVCRIVP